MVCQGSLFARRRHQSIDHTYTVGQSTSVTAADVIKELKARPPDEQRRVLAEALGEVSSHDPKGTTTLWQRAQRRLEHPVNLAPADKNAKVRSVPFWAGRQLPGDRSA
jgi:hypothetical protein